MYTGIFIVLALLLVLLNGIFVAAEFAFVKVRRTRLEILAAQGDRRAKSALFGVSNLDAYLSVCQLGITLSSLGLGWIGEPAVAQLLRPAFQYFDVTNQALVASLSVAVGFTVITFIHVIFGELAPKSISIQKAEATVLLLAWPMRFFYILWFPVVTIMNSITNALLSLFSIRPASESEQAHSSEELRMLITDSRKGGQINEDEGRMLGNIFSFTRKTATDIMQHRMDTLVVSVDESPEQALELTRESGHTRIPVYDGNRDNIIGFIHSRDLLRCGSGKDLRGIVREPVYAPETMHLDQLLRLMQEKRQQFCVVIDEYGIWQGILTMEDIVEAIVGDIQDEFDHEEPDVTPLENGAFLISGQAFPEDLRDVIPLSCAPGEMNDHKIIAAHIIEALGRIPEQGDSVILCGMRFTVTAMDRRRVDKVRVEPLESAEWD